MADLDALFGALDGDVEENDDVTKESEPERKKARISDSPAVEPQTLDALPVTCALADDSTVKETRRGDVDDTALKQSSSFSAVMAQPTAAERMRSSGDGEDKAKNDEAPGKAEAEREIATGTLDKSVRSYSSYPPNYVSTNQKLVDSEPAKVYAFKLDPFQEQAVGYVDQNESVLVAAHTSAGKTAVAEYAIAKCLKHGQRVIYTSPIKALSNQKFRDLQEEFGADNVGLMTGDNTINATATAIVMTTEILRSMLYRGSEIIREVAWVVYDEVHYMRDLERGVVWEESIILLPHQVRFVFLSATIPNAKQFVDWIVKIHHQPCHVVYTNYRPVPLQHYIFPQGGDGLHLVVDEKGSFREKNFQKAMATLQSGNIDAAIGDAMLNSGNGKKRGSKGSSAKKKGGQFADLHRIVKLVMERNLNPVIVFSFSKKDCEKFALALNKEDFTDNIEKDLISQVYYNAIEALGEDDRKLPQVEALLPLLKRGIGIHHGGLLPILKEIVEILFAEGLIKTLFATETFAIGINMPAKTVVFTNTRKWDGKDFRWVTSGEYIQMSGRAGRRGKDDRGIVIQMLDEKMDPAVCKDILYGNPDPLNSSYRISYNMLLNLMRVEDVDPEYLLRASFHQFQREEEAPSLLAQAEDFQKEADRIKDGFPSTEVHDKVGQYFGMDQQMLVTRRRISKYIQKPEYCLRFLTPGRLIDVSIDGRAYGWGLLVSCQKKPGTGAGGEHGRLAELASGPEYTIDVLLNCVKEGIVETGKAEDEEDEASISSWKGSASDCRPLQDGENGKTNASMRLFKIGLDSIDRISAGKCRLPPAYTTIAARRKVRDIVSEIVHRMKEDPSSIPLLDPVSDMGIKDEEFMTLLKRAETLTTRLKTHELAAAFDEQTRLELVARYEKKTLAMEKAKVLRAEAASCQTMAMRGQLKNMKRVLRRLGHVDPDGIIQTKGRTACEISTAHELVVVEMIFTGVFNELSVEQSVALLSAMTFDERNKDDNDPCSGMRSFLVSPFRKLQEIARMVVRVEIACGLQVDEDEFLNQFNPGMMEVVYAWCKGAKFIEIQKLTNSFEGTTIRTLRRLAELVRQMTAAAKAIGNQELETKFTRGEELLKRDIVFCSSLYL